MDGLRCSALSKPEPDAIFDPPIFFSAPRKSLKMRSMIWRLWFFPAPESARLMAYRLVRRLDGLRYLRPASVPMAHKAAAKAKIGWGRIEVSLMYWVSLPTAPLGSMETDLRLNGAATGSTFFQGGTGATLAGGGSNTLASKMASWRIPRASCSHVVAPSTVAPVTAITRSMAVMPTSLAKSLIPSGVMPILAPSPSRQWATARYPRLAPRLASGISLKTQLSRFNNALSLIARQKLSLSLGSEMWIALPFTACFSTFGRKGSRAFAILSCMSWGSSGSSEAVKSSNVSGVSHLYCIPSGWMLGGRTVCLP